MKRAQDKRRAFAFEPGFDTLIAFLTLPAMTAVYYLNAQYGFDQPIYFWVGFVLIGHLILSTMIPLVVVVGMRREPLAGLGVSKNRLILSLGLSILLGGLMYPELAKSLAGAEIDPMPHIISNGILLWEPLFVFGWLQLRFERAFGYMLAPLLAGIGFAAYHIGVFPVEMLIVLVITGTIFGAVFAITRNLLVMLPITWAISSSIGTISGGFAFDWPTVAIYVSVLIVQIIMLMIAARLSRGAQAHA